MESTPGLGSTFKISIDPGDIAEQPNQTSHRPDELTSATIVTSSQRGILENLNILLVEDDPDNQLLVSRFLRTAGAKVDIADNGKMGMEKALVSNYDAILMDIQMPVMDGYASTSALREKGYQKPIIALTARAMTDERDRCLASGFTNHIAKPVDRNDLVGKLLSRSSPVKHS